MHPAATNVGAVANAINPGSAPPITPAQQIQAAAAPPVAVGATPAPAPAPNNNMRWILLGATFIIAAASIYHLFNQTKLFKLQIKKLEIDLAKEGVV